jgi:hypothetical protein
MCTRLLVCFLAALILAGLSACDAGGPPCRGLPDEGFMRDLDARTAVTQRIWDDGWEDICARYGQPPRQGSSALQTWIATTQVEVDQLRARWQRSVNADLEWMGTQNRPAKCLRGSGTRATWGQYTPMGDGTPDYFCDSCKNEALSKYGDNGGRTPFRRL